MIGSPRTRVHLLRHGEVHNPDRLLYGRLPDYHLSDGGREMANKVAASLTGRGITHLMSSPWSALRRPRPRSRRRWD
ncbi:MAG: histidine phosphatase family protein [Geodermatophilaceae bacterium]